MINLLKFKEKQMKRKLLSIIAGVAMILVANTNTVQAQSSFTMPVSAEYINKSNVSIPVSMNNEGDVVGFQCDIYLPEGMDIQENETNPIILSERAKTHTLAFKKQTDGAIRVVVFSMANTGVIGNEGELFTIPVNVPTQEGDYVVEIKNIHITGIAAIDTKLADVSTTQIFKYYQPGDVNGSGNVSIADVSTLIAKILGDDPEVFIMEAADLNGDGYITIADVAAVVNIIITQGTNTRASFMSRATDTNDKIFMEDFNIQPGETKTIEVKLSNIIDYTAFQCDLYLPEGIRVVAENGKHLVNVSSRMTDSHSITSGLQQDGSLRIVAYSMQNSNFTDTDETIFTVTVQADEDIALQTATSSIKKALLATSRAAEYQAPETVANVSPMPTSIQDNEADAFTVFANNGTLYIQASQAANLTLVAMDGTQQTLAVTAGLNSFPIANKGIYVVNNQKVVIQ